MNKLLLITLMTFAFMGNVAADEPQQTENMPQSEPATVDNPYVKPEKTLIGELRPDFTLPDLDGVQRNVKEWNGKILVINFWATWCRPCLHEIPDFIKLQDKYNEQGLQFVGLAMQSTEEIREFIAEVGMNYPALAGIQDVSKVGKLFGNRFGVLPYTVMIDRNQKIVFIKSGPLSYDEADYAIKALIAL
jgi:peroxiredoxin